MTINEVLKQYLIKRLDNGSPFISSHEFEDVRDHIKAVTGLRHNVSTIERVWRKLRENNEVQTLNADIPGKREKVWKIVSVNIL